jgi:DNA-binding winged helix-turn-helix (wHTH) protein
MGRWSLRRDPSTLLLQKPDEVIGKTELFDAVWAGMVLEENTLQVHISALRKALAACMITTVHGRGYKYAGPRPVLAQATNGAGEAKPTVQTVGSPGFDGTPTFEL